MLLNYIVMWNGLYCMSNNYFESWQMGTWPFEGTFTGITEIAIRKLEAITSNTTRSQYIGWMSESSSSSVL